MAFNIDNFVSNLDRYGTLQTNKFDVIVTVPPLLVSQFALTPVEERNNAPLIGGLNETASILRFRAERINLPGVVIDTDNNRRYGVGPREKYGTNVSFSDFSTTFLEDGNNSIYKLFFYWTNLIFDYGAVYSPSGGIGSPPTYLSGYKSDYQTFIEVRIFDNSGRQQNRVLFREAYPISVSDVSLGWSDNNNLFRTSVSFAYTDWTIL